MRCGGRNQHADPLDPVANAYRRRAAPGGEEGEVGYGGRSGVFLGVERPRTASVAPRMVNLALRQNNFFNQLVKIQIAVSVGKGGKPVLPHAPFDTVLFRLDGQSLPVLSSTGSTG
jgi:hypothetical protein